MRWFRMNLSLFRWGGGGENGVVVNCMLLKFVLQRVCPPFSSTSKWPLRLSSIRSWPTVYFFFFFLISFFDVEWSEQIFFLCIWTFVWFIKYPERACIEYLGFYFYKWLKLKNQTWISKDNHRVTSSLIEIESEEDVKWMLSITLIIQYIKKSRYLLLLHLISFTPHLMTFTRYLFHKS